MTATKNGLLLSDLFVQLTKETKGSKNIIKTLELIAQDAEDQVNREHLFLATKLLLEEVCKINGLPKSMGKVAAAIKEEEKIEEISKREEEDETIDFVANDEEIDCETSDVGETTDYFETNDEDIEVNFVDDRDEEIESNFEEVDPDGVSEVESDKEHCKEVNEKNNDVVAIRARKFQCKSCKKKYKKEISLETHIQGVHLDTLREFMCYTCEAKFKTLPNLLSHLEARHNKCPFCDKVTEKFSYLKIHIQNMHSETREWVCEICGKHFGSRNNLNGHRKFVHFRDKKDDRCKCEDCGKIYRSKTLLKRHFGRIHATKKEFSCHICGQTFADAYNLKAHFDNNHKLKEKVQCSFCGMQVSKRYLRSHVKMIHEKVKQRECSLCGEKFTFSVQLTRHKRRFHGGVEPKRNLSEVTRPFECEICKKKFCRNSVLQIHVSRVHEKKHEFHCECCKKSFHQSWDLQKHNQSKIHATNYLQTYGAKKT